MQNELDLLLSTVASDILKHGNIQEKVKVADKEFTLKVLTTGDYFLANSIDSLNELSSMYGEGNVESYRDIIPHLRNTTQLSFAITSIDGIEIHKAGDTQTETSEKARSVRRLLYKLNTRQLDELTKAYTRVIAKEKQAFENIDDVTKK